MKKFSPSQMRSGLTDSGPDGPVPDGAESTASGRADSGSTEAGWPVADLTDTGLTDVEAFGQRNGVQTGLGRWNGQPVFVKSLLTDDPDTVARFHHEGQVAQVLDHPQVIPLLHHTGTDLVFPFVPGGTLRDLVRCGPMSADEATTVVWGILEAVAHLHGRGVVHHDLKPENVMLMRGNPGSACIRLIDFGMSHAVHLPLDIHSGTRMGTPHFMPPEQFRGVRGDPRSDLYSVGVLLFDCLAGHPPYEDALGWLIGVTENRAEFPGPSALHPLMLSAIQRDLDSRPQSAQAMLDQLAQARHDLNLPPLTRRAAHEGPLPCPARLPAQERP